MRKLFLLNLFFLAFVTVFAQDNLIDSLGLKQGEWKEYRVYPMGISFNVPVMETDSVMIVEEEVFNYDEFIIITCKGTYFNNLRIGKWYEYLPNGIIKSEVNYFNGICLGKFIYYYDSGGKMMEGKFDLSKKTFVKSYDKDGRRLKDRFAPTLDLITIITR